MRYRLTESNLRNMIREAIKSSINEVNFSNFDFSKTPGIDLRDIKKDWGVTPADVKQKLGALQTALKDVMELTNGAIAGENFSKAMWDKCYDFYQFISQYMVELKKDCRGYDGTWQEDHSDIPFIRQYGEDSEIPPYYTKDGNIVGDEHFRTNFQPHKR